MSRLWKHVPIAEGAATPGPQDVAEPKGAQAPVGRRDVEPVSHDGEATGVDLDRSHLGRGVLAHRLDQQNMVIARPARIAAVDDGDSRALRGASALLREPADQEHGIAVAVPRE